MLTQQLANAWAGGVNEFSVYVLRILFIPLLLYNMSWSFKGCVNFMKRKTIEVSVYKSMIFFMSVGTLIRQGLFFTGYPNESVGPIALTSLCLMMLASVLATLTHHFNLAAKLNHFYWILLHEHSHLALRTIELARLNQRYMEGVLDVAETRIAVDLANKVLKSSDS